MQIETGYTKKELRACIYKVVQSGSNGSVRLLEVDTPRKCEKRLKKAINASTSMTMNNETVWSNGKTFRGILSKGPKVTVQMLGHGYRYQILHLDRFGKRTVYAVPIVMAANLSGLPGLDLNTDELSLVQSMADELESCFTPEELFFET